ncbi:hypothetical protein QCA50_019642 [Cerrena zonata]|uniref:Major facilitator superfamily (MFS) profile domain-containing protein n=1 Tax=Cerrena zonata TaxID=2478898 RepID=A0AAW0FGY8_9APHY
MSGTQEEQPLLQTSSSPNTDNSHSLHPAVLRDASSGGAGFIAGELAAEEESLHLPEHDNYGSVGLPGSKKDDNNKSSDSDYALPRAKLLTVVSSLFMAAYLAALDTTVVTTLLTVIASDLNAVANISWIATAYLLSCSAFQPLFVIGRFVTGWGGSGLTTLGTITMSDLIPLRDRGLYQGMANIFFGLGAASGGILGGLVADYLGWKYVFILQVPLAVVVGVVIWWNLVLPEGSPGLGAHGSEFKDKLKRVDFQGSFFLVSALMVILTAASLGGREIAYDSKTFIGLVLWGSLQLKMVKD